MEIIKSLKRKIERFKIYSFSFIKGLGWISEKEEDTSKFVLLLFFGRIGDIVVFLDVMNKYKDLFVHNQGKKIVFGCRNEVWDFLENVGASKELVFFELNRENLFNSFKYFKEKVYQANQYRPSSVLNVRESYIIENAFIHSINSKNKIVCRVYPVEHNSVWSKYFSFRTYTKDISVPSDFDYLTSQAYLIRMLGMNDYKSVIPVLPKYECNELPEALSYVCICPGASMENKCWPIDRYSQVIDFILAHSYLNVVMCGGKSEQGLSDRIIEMVHERDRVLSYVGKVSIKEWISLIQGALFVVCNESAAAHISAGSHVNAICIGEQKFGDKWLPYRPEIKKDDDKNPIIIRANTLKCSFCAMRNFRRSKECEKCYKENGVVKCVFDVRTEQVVESIERMLKEKSVFI